MSSNSPIDSSTFLDWPNSLWTTAISSTTIPHYLEVLRLRLKLLRNDPRDPRYSPVLLDFALRSKAEWVLRDALQHPLPETGRKERICWYLFCQNYIKYFITVNNNWNYFESKIKYNLLFLYFYFVVKMIINLIQWDILIVIGRRDCLKIRYSLMSNL